ncbi:MAG: D-alanyl-D-alanine carboxypeptidase [Gammaproteobacteria bacterium]|nr:D-alanyl-D-alanine carboxypeptidase [Gammaproteobacteria bacterium]MBK9426314.1 D-alanyl-D-alanine carboxypeptidase [Gammaproteobacteria bacterium]
MTRNPASGVLLLLSLLTSVAIAGPVPAPAPAPVSPVGAAPMPAPVELAAKAWILIDAYTGTVLAEHNADERLPPASLTKLVTDYLIAGEMAAGKFTKDTLVPISVNAWRMGGSKMYVREGTEVPVGDLLRGIIVQSGNDASVAMAEYIAGTEDAFAQLMNQRAQQLGMTNSHFVNATGWPAEGHLTTARDLSILFRATIHDYPENYRLYSEKYFEYNGIKQPNRNLLLWRDSTVDGGKTGHTEEAGYCLVVSAVRENMRLVGVVMGTGSVEARARETQKLLAYGFRFYETARMYKAGEVLQADAPVWFGKDDKVNLTVAEDVYLTLPRGAQKDLKATVLVDDAIEAPLSPARPVGRLQVEQSGKVVLTVPLVPDREVAEAGWFARLWDHLVLFLTSLFS